MNIEPLKRKIYLSLIFVSCLFLGTFSFTKALNELYLANASVQGAYTTQAIGPVYNKKAYVLIYNPVFDNGQKLTEYMGWNNPDTQASQYIDWLKVTTNNKVNFTVFFSYYIYFPTFFKVISIYNLKTLFHKKLTS